MCFQPESLPGWIIVFQHILQVDLKLMNDMMNYIIFSFFFCLRNSFLLLYEHEDDVY